MAHTPMMQQYHDAKAACGDALLLFRMGDFYELFFEDAKNAASLLGLTLTSRDKGDNPIPMAGFPHHQLDSYLQKIILAGHRAAVCEQVEDPKKTKGLVRREVTRVVSRGTVTDDALLDPAASNYLAAVAGGAPTGVAWIDISTGKFQAASVPTDGVADLLAHIEPVELLVSEDDTPPPQFDQGDVVVTRRPPWEFAERAATEALNRQFRTASLEGFGFSLNGDGVDTPSLRAAGGVLAYLNETQQGSLAHVQRLMPYRVGNCLEIDPAARRSLELIRTLRDGRRDGSLLDVLDDTVTSMGSRRLADWLAEPLVDVAAIEARHNAIDEWLHDTSACESLRAALKDVYDTERLLARVSTGRATPRDLRFIGRTLAQLPQIKAKLTGRQSDLLCDLETRLDLCVEIRSKLDAALVDDCPLSAKEGGIIQAGFHTDLDELRELTSGGKQWIARYQAEEIERTGINNLKVGFNRVFGYYLEVTHAQADKVPSEYIRKQTLKGAERYITPQLKEHEEKVLAAEDRSKELEYELFVSLRDTVAAELPRILQSASVLAELDVLLSLSEIARSRGYCRPTMTDQPVLSITAGRHPVIDAVSGQGTFVPNDSHMDARSNDNQEDCTSQKIGRVLIITGPNMAGKSTYIRQVALITILAQMGSFVPAESAIIGVADRIFARIGASDELSRGQSTFMVEMTEAARILNTATRQSLVILDEVGRGTSTYDGVSLAQSIVEHLHDQTGCRTLFATHYHELTELADMLDGVVNLNVAVREWEQDIVFLHQIVAGAADKSYGIHVARLAGVPSSVSERAGEILAEHQQHHHAHTSPPRPHVVEKKDPVPGMQLTLFETQDHPVIEELKDLAINQLTPLEALNTLNRWRGEL